MAKNKFKKKLKKIIDNYVMCLVIYLFASFFCGIINFFFSVRFFDTIRYVELNEMITYICHRKIVRDVQKYVLRMPMRFQLMLHLFRAESIQHVLECGPEH